MKQGWISVGLTALMVLLAVTGCRRSAPTASALPEGLWIDVRTAEEFAQGHIVGALNIPYDQIADRIADVAPDKQAVIHLYCRSGRRSGIALATLQQLGYTAVVNDGAFARLRERGLPTEP